MFANSLKFILIFYNHPIFKISLLNFIKFKSEINSIPLKQYNITYFFKNNKLKMQNCKSLFSIKGLDQIPKNADFANANLLKKVTELEKESEQFDSVDSKLQVWNEVDDIINNNISPLLEVTSKDDVIALLDAISDSSTKVDKSVIADDMKKLQDNIESTKQKINTVKEAEKE